VYEMPHTLAALEAGRLSEWRATLIVRESACLDVADRRALDAELCADGSKLDGMGDARIAAAARAIAYRLNAQAVVDRAAKAESERTVSIRPAPDTMSWVRPFRRERQVLREVVPACGWASGAHPKGGAPRAHHPPVCAPGVVPMRE
jgi:hypothetical protein